MRRRARRSAQPLAVLACAIRALLWAIDDGQYDDLERHGSMTLEEEKAEEGAGFEIRH
jgi:cbb3-type cytochrome oxidase maturation protein